MPSKPNDPPCRSGVVLIADSDVEFATDFISRFFATDYELRLAHAAPDAFTLLDALAQLSLALVDLDIPGCAPYPPAHNGGAGLHVVERIRERFPLARVVVLARNLQPHLINSTQKLGAELLVKDGCGDNLQTMARAVLATRNKTTQDATLFVEHFARSHALTKRQTEVLGLSLTGRSRAEIAADLGISSNTLKRHVRDILGASRQRSLEAIVRRFWRELISS